jgi:regulator of nonsense transcripts 2
MRSQQQAERAEQQRIKNLVLNYDLHNDQHDGEEPAFHYVLSPNSKRTRLVGTGSLNRCLPPRHGNDGCQSQRSTSLDERQSNHSLDLLDAVLTRQDSFTDETGGIDTLHGQPRQDKSGNTRSKQRARKLQLGDIDWYGDRSRFTSAEPPPQQYALSDFTTDKKSNQRRASRGGKRGNKRGSWRADFWHLQDITIMSRTDCLSCEYIELKALLQNSERWNMPPSIATELETNRSFDRAYRSADRREALEGNES